MCRLAACMRVCVCVCVCVLSLSYQRVWCFPYKDTPSCRWPGMGLSVTGHLPIWAETLEANQSGEGIDDSQAMR